MAEHMDYHVVVVDDAALSLTNVRILLEEKGMRVNCLRSGRDLLKYMAGHTADLILLDIMMPEMDGFETLEELRKLEDGAGRSHTPVIFLTGENDSEVEKRGLSAGASDYIRKPFNQDILITRIQNTVTNSKTIGTLTEEATVDRLTGFLNKGSGTARIAEMVSSSIGSLMVMDLDSFKLVNDLYGHDMGDKVLSAFADIVRKNIRSEDVVARIGGDEFMGFFSDIADEPSVASLTKRLNAQLLGEAKRLMGDDFMVPLGISIGAVMIPEYGRDYEILFAMADGALYDVKQNGKHGYALYEKKITADGESIDDLDLEFEHIMKIMEERNDKDGALLLGMEAFSVVYRFIKRFNKLHGGKAVRLLLALNPEEGMSDEAFTGALGQFSTLLQRTLRKSDIIMQNRPGRFFVFLPELSETDVPGVIARILDEWKKTEYCDVTQVRYVMKMLDS